MGTNYSSELHIDKLVKTMQKERAFADDNCAICLEGKMNPRKDTMLQCGHIFHKDCVQRVENCPLCRGPPIVWQPFSSSQFS